MIQAFHSQLRLQLLIPILLLFVAIGGSGVFIIHELEKRDIRQQIIRRAELAAHSIQFSAETSSSVSQIQRYVAAAGAEDGITFAVVIAGSPPHVVATTELALQGVPANLLAARIGSAILATRTQVHFFEDEHLLRYIEPLLITNVIADNQPLGKGALIIEIDTANANEATATIALRLSLLLSGALTIVGVTLWLLISRLVLRPQNRLLEATERRGRGELSLAVVSGDNELARLAQAFNEMLTRNDEQAAHLKKLNSRLADMAHTDSLTGIANRRRFDEFLVAEVKRSRRHARWLSVLMCDVDFFKQYNDHYGHQSGDIALIGLANLLALSSRDDDLAARIGGEEFAIVMPETTAPQARIFAERLRKLLAKRHIDHAHSSVSDALTLSIGVYSTVPTVGTSPANILAQADAALYWVKENGRDQVRVIEGRRSRSPDDANAERLATGTVNKPSGKLVRLKES